MTAIAVLAGLTVLAMSIGLARSRLPWDVVRVGYVLGIATPLLALAYATWQLWHRWVGWPEIALLAGLYVLVGLGMTVGYHRLLTHRSFETGPLVRGVLLVLGAMSMPARPLDFAPSTSSTPRTRGPVSKLRWVSRLGIPPYAQTHEHVEPGRSAISRPADPPRCPDCPGRVGPGRGGSRDPRTYPTRTAS